jgi:hypothetical protein
MNYYPKYLSLLNKDIVGGAVAKELYNSGTILNAAMTWNIQHNRFLKLPIMLQLVKLSKETIKAKIIKDPANYEIFLNLLLIAIDDHEQYFKDKYPTLYDKYLEDNYLHTDPPSLSGKKHVIYVKNLINFFIETHKSIDQLLAINNQQLDEETAKDVQKFLGISRDYYYKWRFNLNKYYGEKDFMGLPARDNPDGTGKEDIPQQAEPNKAASLYTFLTSKDTGNIINGEYNNLPEKTIISYLKIRLDADELDAKIYNHRFNVYLEDLKSKGKDRLTTPQSMFLTGPQPYHNIYYYPKNKKDASLIPTLQELRAKPEAYPNYDVRDYDDLEINKETGNVENVKKYSYGNLYGPLTRIFGPEENNNEVSKDCIEIVNQLKANSSIVIIGYGGSGAGKTSALVYYKKGKKGEREGILLNILKNPELGNPQKITVSFHELFGDADTGVNEHKSRNYNGIVFEKDATGVYNIHADTFIKKDGTIVTEIGDTYTEKVRTQISDAQYKALKNKIIDEKTAEHPIMVEIQNGKIITKAPKNFGTEAKPIYKIDPGYQYLIDEAIDKIEDIVWTETIYKWVIKNRGDGILVFTGKDTLAENIADINKKIDSEVNEKKKEQLTILQQKYIAMQTKGEKLYDPRILCIADKDGNLDDEDKELCNPANWKGEPIQVKNLGTFLLTVTDRLRMINPTTNNPVSSRSHGLIYIKLPFVKSDGTTDYTKSKYFCVADLAGVEDRFICSSPDTQSAFLNLDYIDRITGQAIKGPALNGEDGNPLLGEDGKPVFQKIPHYTTNTKLSWTNLPNDEKSQKILKFLGYDPIKKNITNNADYQTKVTILKTFSKKFNMYNEGGLIPPFNVDFGNAGVDPNQRYIEFLQKPYADLLDQMMAIKSEEKYRQSNLANSGTTNSLKELYNFITNSTVTASGNEGIFFQIKRTPSVMKFYEGLKIYKASLSNPAPQGTLTQEQIAKVLQEKISQGLAIPENVYDSMKKFYSSRYPDGADVINSAFADANLMFGTTNTKGLYQKLEDNLSIFKKSGVEQLCNERAREGDFINLGLIGMSKSISLLIQDLSASSEDGDKGLVKNIPLVKEPCFKFYCDREHETCFSQYVDDNITKYNDAILADITEMIGDQIKKLKIGIFAVLNINRKASDYQKIPYIDINKLKYARDQYITYAHFLQENNQVFKDSLLADVKLVLFGTGDVENPSKDTCFYIIDRFKDNIGVTLSAAPKNIYRKFSNPDSNFFKTLVELIGSIDVLNSLSYIGTMDFLNNVKNVYSTDKVCKLETDNDKKDYSEPIDKYLNAVTGKALYVELSRQKGKVPSNIQLRGQSIETEKLPKGVAKANSSSVPVSPGKGQLLSIDSILGGYMDDRASYVNQKDELINEHKQLKEMYRRLKNNVI